MPTETLVQLFGLTVTELPPRYNIAPTQNVLAVVGNHGQKEVHLQHWGLIPSWAKDDGIGRRLINARSEDLMEKPSFRNSFKRRRCLIPAMGFFEWKHTDVEDERADDAAREGQLSMFYEVPSSKPKKTKVVKQPYLIGFGGRPFCFGAIWDTWYSPYADHIDSCAILTTSPNGLVSGLHDRMPVIIAPEHYDEWLHTGEAQASKLVPLMAPYPDDEMTAYPVSSLVNSPLVDEPAVLERIS